MTDQPEARSKPNAAPGSASRPEGAGPTLPHKTIRRTRTERTQAPNSQPPSRLKRLLASLLQPSRPLGPAPGFLSSLRAIILASYLNVLLMFIPLAWAFHFVLPSSFRNKDTLVFAFSFLSIIPLAKLLAFATDELSLRVGQSLAGFLNATLGNAVELVVAIIALLKCELRIVQSSLVGSILSNLLLVLGTCKFMGGMRYSEQGFGFATLQINYSLLTASIIAVLLPTALYPPVSDGDRTAREGESSHILSVSHGTATVLLFIYAAYITYCLNSQVHLYEEREEHVIRPARRTSRSGKLKSEISDDEDVPGVINAHIHTLEAQDEEEPETPQLNFWVSVLLLATTIVLLVITAIFLVDSIEGITESGRISKRFVGLILLPIAGNFAEHITAVTVSVKDRLILSLGIAVGSSIQIALFVAPLAVTLGWILGKPLTLLFDPYESIALFLTVMTVNYLVQDGKSNWLEGLLLISLYVVFGIAFWFYPGTDPSGTLARCH